MKHRRAGRLVYYSLDDEHIRGLFAQGLEHVREEMNPALRVVRTFSEDDR